MNSANVQKTVSFEAVVFPPCQECGAPYKQTPIDYGTVHFESPDHLATFYYKLERFFKNRRIARLRSK